jgi:DnaD/phage-associated family protein
MIKYKLLPLSVSDKEAFIEASREELRVLLVLVELSGAVNSSDELARLAGISKTRASSALTFWKEAGVIKENESAPTITEEFEEKIQKGEITEVPMTSVAKSIRDSKLSDMISECASFMGRSALNTQEIKQLTALHEQYALSPEYIVMLSAHMAEGGKLTPTRLVNQAVKLCEREIDDTAKLEEYIVERESTSEAEREFRKLFGVYNRALSKSEKEAFRKWSSDYGYFTNIVGEAYDIAVSKTDRGHLKYVDKLLTRWYETGCRTLGECRARYEADAEENKQQKTSKKKKTETEQYGNFDTDYAFMKAIERSYGSLNLDDDED